MSIEKALGGTFEIANVSPVTFNVTVKAATLAQINEWKSGLRERHTCIEKIDSVNGFDSGGRLYYVRTFWFMLRSDADYQQICALRTELKT